MALAGHPAWMALRQGCAEATSDPAIVAHPTPTAIDWKPSMPGLEAARNGPNAHFSTLRFPGKSRTFPAGSVGTVTLVCQTGAV